MQAHNGFVYFGRSNSEIMATQQPLTYLALGDSYTVGEQVKVFENFPYLTTDLLRRKQMQVMAPDIVAVTGWTTDELAAGIQQRALLHQYDFVTLLIGVNNQYRGRSVAEYKKEYEDLLQQAIRFANGNSKRVFVLSIPDWGVTPYAKERDQVQIATEIDAYNTAKQAITEAHGAHYLDITASTRANAATESFMAADGLHPSANEYKIWADALARQIFEQFTSE